MQLRILELGEVTGEFQKKKKGMIFYDLWSLELSIDFALSHFCSSDIVCATEQNVGDTIFIGFGSNRHFSALILSIYPEIFRV